MKVTRKSYEKAKQVVEAAREQGKLVEAWERAATQVGENNGQQLEAVIVNDDGTIRVECSLASSMPVA
jgi:phage I-like protein